MAAAPGAEPGGRVIARVPEGSLERLQVLHQRALLRVAEGQPEGLVVVVDHVAERLEPSVVLEAARLVRPEAAQRSGPVATVRGAARLEVVDPDLGAGVADPARLG